MNDVGNVLGRGARRAAALFAAAALVASMATGTPAQAAKPPPTGATATTVVVKACDRAGLAAALAAVPERGKGVIRMRCDGVIDVLPGGTMEVNGQRDVTIDARGREVVFDGHGAALPFFVGNQSMLQLRHLTVRNGSSEPLPAGGAIFNAGSLRIDDVLFENNHGYNGGGAISSRGAGSVTISNSRFVGNQSTCRQEAAGGGALSHASSGPLTITRSTFTDNRAVGLGAGGAIYLRPDKGVDPVGAAVISRSVFSGNTSEVDGGFLTVGGGGGALSSHGRPVTVDRSTFEGNSTNYHGGAIRHTRDTFLPWLGNVARGPGGPLTVTRSTFTGNAATGVPITDDYREPGVGGAVVVEGPDAFSIDNSTFRDNSASQAGALATTSPGTISRSVFERNVGTDASLTQQSDALMGNGAAAVVRVSRTVLRDHALACTPLFGATFLDGGRNREQPGSTCGFAARRISRR